MSMSTIRMRDILALIAVVAIIVAMIPTVVLTGLVGAADNGTITVDFQTGNSPPTVDNVTLYDNATTTITTMTPLVEYVIRVNVTEGLTFDNLTTVTAWLYRSDNSTFVWPNYTDTDNQTRAKFTWTKSTGLFSMVSNGTWELVQADCHAPGLGSSTGSFDFHFKPGKVAQESTSDSHEWHVYAVADNGANIGDNHQTGLEMAWYSEISVGSAVHFGSVNLGAADQQSPAFSNTYVANGTYARAVSAATSWTNGSATLSLVGSTPGASQFALKANETTGAPGATQVNGSYANLSTGHGITGDAGDLISSNYLFLSLGSTGVPSGTYSGNVYYEIHS